MAALEYQQCGLSYNWNVPLFYLEGSAIDTPLFIYVFVCASVWVCVRVQKIVRRIKNYNNCHNNSTGGKKRQSSGWEHKHTAQCQIKHYPIPKGSYRQLIYVDYNLSGDMRIQDGHFGALSWRIKQIIGLSRRNTKEGSHETGTERQRQHGTFCRSITYHTILCFYLYSCHGRPNTPHATCHTAPSRLDQHFLYWLWKKAKK